MQCAECLRLRGAVQRAIGEYLGAALKCAAETPLSLAYDEYTNARSQANIAWHEAEQELIRHENSHPGGCGPEGTAQLSSQKQS